MLRGMIPDVAHLPQRGIVRALEILEAADYPATSTHQQNYGGDLYALGGLSPVHFAGCAAPDTEGSMVEWHLARV